MSINYLNEQKESVIKLIDYYFENLEKDLPINPIPTAILFRLEKAAYLAGSDFPYTTSSGLKKSEHKAKVNSNH